MNKTRFYEILQAHKKGEDLGQFIPTNPAEAALLADLSGGGESTGGGMPEFRYNNPDLPGLYYSLATHGKILKIDIEKFITTYEEEVGPYLDRQVTNSSSSATGRYHLVSVACYNQSQTHGYDLILEWGPVSYAMNGGSGIQGISLYLAHGEGSRASVCTFKSVPVEPNMTAKEFLRALADAEGIVEVSFDNEGVTNMFTDYFGYSPEDSFVIEINDLTNNAADLNAKPIDYMWFE